MKTRQLFTAILALTIANTVMAQSQLQLVHSGETLNFEGNQGTLPQYVMASHSLESGCRITFSDNQMHIQQGNADYTYNIADIEKASVSGNINKMPIFYPPSVSRMLNYETETDLDLDLNYAAGKSMDKFDASSVVEIDVSSLGNSLTLEPTEPTIYKLAGSNKSLQITLSGEKEAMILLDNAAVQYDDSPAIISESSATLYVATTANSRNSISGIVANGAGGLSLSGEGLLRIVTHSANSPAVRAAADIAINGGTLNIFTSGDSSQGIYSDKNVSVNNGAINIITKGGGLQQDDNLGFDCAVGICAGINNVKTDGCVNVRGGKVRIKAIGGIGAIGVAAMHKITINNAMLLLSTFDDGMNAVDGIETGNSRIFSTSAVDDAIDTNGSLVFRGGTMYACGPYPKEAAFDNDGKNFVIEDGITLVALGAKTDKPMAYKSTCPIISLKDVVTKKYVIIRDAEGQEIISFITPQYPDKCAIVVASPKIQPLTTYEVFTADKCLNGLELYGIITDGVFGATEKLADVISSEKK